MKKLGVFSILLVAMLFMLAACGGGDSQSSGNSNGSNGTVEDSADSLQLKSADVVAETSPYTEGMKYFTEKVKESTDGKFQIKHFPAGQLGSDQEIVEGVQFGSIDFAITGGVNGSKVTNAFYLPYLFKSEEHLSAVIDGEIGEKLKKRFEEETDGLKLIGMVYYAPRLLTTNGREVKNLDDLKGLKIRVPNDPISIEAWEALGTSPTPIEFTELYTALQTGVVNGQENPYEIILNNSFYEVQDTIIETYHSYPARFFIMNEDLYNSLSEDEQKTIGDTWKETAAKIKEIYVNNEQDYIEQLKEKGMKFIEPDIEPFIEATKEVRDQNAIEAFGKEIYQEIQALGESK